jgi:hypothetical protein
VSDGHVLEFPALEHALRGAVTRSAASVHVVGRPGGLLRLHGHDVVDAWSVGTPLGVPSPGRRARDGDPRQPARFAAIADILFAMASGPVHAVWEEPDPPTEEGGIDLEHLLRETRRRLAVINHGESPSLRADTLLTAASAGGRDNRLLSTHERMVLGLVGSGVIAVRDIAFLVDRGLYAVTLDVGRLVEVGLVEVAPLAAPVPPRAAVAAAAPTAHPQAVPSLPATPPAAATDAPAADHMPVGGVRGLFSRRRRQPPTFSGTSATVTAPQLTRRVPGQSGMSRPGENRAT